MGFPVAGGRVGSGLAALREGTWQPNVDVWGVILV